MAKKIRRKPTKAKLRQQAKKMERKLNSTRQKKMRGGSKTKNIIKNKTTKRTKLTRNQKINNFTNRFNKNVKGDGNMTRYIKSNKQKAYDAIDLNKEFKGSRLSSRRTFYSESNIKDRVKQYSEMSVDELTSIALDKSKVSSVWKDRVKNVLHEDKMDMDLPPVFEKYAAVPGQLEFDMANSSLDQRGFLMSHINELEEFMVKQGIENKTFSDMQEFNAEEAAFLAAENKVDSIIYRLMMIPYTDDVHGDVKTREAKVQSLIKNRDKAVGRYAVAMLRKISI